MIFVDGGVSETSKLDVLKKGKTNMNPTQRISLLALICALGLTFSPPTFGSSQGVPEGWILKGSNPDGYRVGVDSGNGFVAGVGSSPYGFGTLMQKFYAETYHGHRLRLTAEIRSEDIADWAGMWLRVDACGCMEQLSLDNMFDRPIEGTTDWQQYEIVLDVPSDATAISFGVLLNGPGQIFFDNFKLESLGQTIPTTDLEEHPSKPSNLSFSN